MSIQREITWLFLLSIPIACVAWTVTHEEVFREPREYCTKRSLNSKSILVRKFFYLFTCEYCFSHYISIIFIILTDFHLLMDDWRGYLIAGFSLVWIANTYMSLFGLIRQDISKEKAEIREIVSNLKEAPQKNNAKV
ncbi:hypothetical protein [Pedobacter jejuensis]|uniref:DUF1360 domain-containing protein n=1 Tax=Pedobacter jejuensis TaxID=1268550 RepID=A0A3N0C1C3_9SPHI|nr:hypothetical protein [Pedobacter jejuensis]RNL56053.1 hypothetical protein D7004_02160 [Pedobacter jejuensis]